MANQPRCGRLRTVSTERNEKKNIDDLIGDNRQIKVREMVEELGMSQCWVREMRRSLGPLVAALAAGGPRTLTKIRFLKLPMKVCGRRRRPSS
jgi:hypothetical protein